MTINGKNVAIYKADVHSAPMVVLNSFMETGEELLAKCSELLCPDFTLVEISGLDWNNELSPWASPPVGRDNVPFGGGADGYFETLIGEIIPAAVAQLDKKPRSVILAGYSLAGLFALYASTKCDMFRAVASCSGSMWYPGFKEYILYCDISRLPKSVYFSLGDREALTSDETLRTVEDNTREISEHLAEKGIKTVFELNKGNHFKQSVMRIAKGICRILEMCK